MSKRWLQIKLALAVLCSGPLLLGTQCTSDNVQTQLANGLNTTILNVLGLGTSELANEVFDVDD
jgi:hypothetical protein